jgi:hypothetical protein
MDVLGDVVKVVGIVVTTIIIVGATIWLVVHDRSRLSKLEAAWRAFASARGFEFSPHKGWFLFHPGMGQAPSMAGAVDGVPVVVQIAGARSFNSTRVVAVVQAPFAAPAPGSPVLPERLEGDAAYAWERLAKRRREAQMIVWPDAGGQQTLALGWDGLEQEPTVLESAMALVATLARRPPASYGEPSRWIPKHRMPR